MIRSLSTIAAMALLALCTSAPAATIYKCRQAGGVTSYQDAPCPGRQIGVLRTPTTAAQANAKPAPAAAAPAPGTAAAGPAPGTAGTAQTRARPSTSARAPRPSFKCVRPDGSYYYNGDARSQRTLVDLPNDGKPLPQIPGAPAAPPGKTWAQDQCEAATRADTCKYYEDQIAYNDAQQKRASGDELRKLTREGQRLRAIHNHRCG